MSKRTELRKDCRDLAAEIKRLADKNADPSVEWTAELEERWDKVNADYDGKSKTLQKLDRAAAAERETREEEDTEVRSAVARAWRQRGEDEDADRSGRDRSEPRNVIELQQQRALAEFRHAEDQIFALQGWCCHHAGLELRDEHLDAFKRLKLQPNAKEFVFELRSITNYDRIRRALGYELRQMSTATTEGGDVIPPGFVQEFERALLAFGGMRAYSQVLRTPTGNSLTWPMSNDTGNAGALVAENAAVGTQAVATAPFTLTAYKYTSKIIQVSTELMMDSAFDLASILGEIIGERIGRAENAAFTTGDGSSKPTGIVTGAAAGVTAASATAITADEIIDLFHSVGRAYRSEPSSAYMMSDGIVKLVRKLKDGDSQYLWQPGMQAGIPDQLFGRPLVVNDSMAAAAVASAVTMLFGDLRKYKIREVGSVRLRRADELYMENDQVAFVGFSRVDGKLQDAGTNPVKKLTQAAS